MTPVEIGGTVPGPRDFGIVTELPTAKAKVGDFCTYKVEAGFYWRLMYTGEETYPWAKVGGPAIWKVAAAVPVSTASSTSQTTNSPSWTAPLAMTFNGQFGASLAIDGAAALNQMEAQLRINGVDVGMAAYHVALNNFGGGSIRGGQNNYVVAKGQVIQTVYRSLSAQTSNFYNLFFEVDPVRVG